MRRISRVCWRVRLGELSGEARPCLVAGSSKSAPRLQRDWNTQNTAGSFAQILCAP